MHILLVITYLYLFIQKRQISQPDLSCRNIDKAMQNCVFKGHHHNNIPVHQALSSSLWQENLLLDFNTPPYSPISIPVTAGCLQNLKSTFKEWTSQAIQDFQKNATAVLKATPKGEFHTWF